VGKKSFEYSKSYEDEILVTSLLSAKNSTMEYKNNNSSSDGILKAHEIPLARPKIYIPLTPYEADFDKIDNMQEGGSIQDSMIRQIISDNTSKVVDANPSRNNSFSMKNVDTPKNKYSTPRSCSPSRAVSPNNSSHSVRLVIPSPKVRTPNALFTLSDSDRNALRLGKMLLGTLWTIPDLNDGDMLKKFFFDKWLESHGSSTKQTDAFNIDLICEMQNYIAKARFDCAESSASSIGSNDNDSMFAPLIAYPSEKYENVSLNKQISSIALEMFDVLIVEFGETHPIFKVIKEALLPIIFKNQDSSDVKNALMKVGDGDFPTETAETNSFPVYLEQTTW
jgi:hypothetical protein